MLVDSYPRFERDFNSDILSLRGPENQEMIDDLVASAPFIPTNQPLLGGPVQLLARP